MYDLSKMQYYVKGFEVTVLECVCLFPPFASLIALITIRSEGQIVRFFCLSLFDYVSPFSSLSSSALCLHRSDVMCLISHSWLE